MLEIGCGVGNTVIPLLDKNPSAFVYGCDYADSAIEILKNHPSVVDTDSNRCRIWQQDIRREIPADIIEIGSLDIIVSIFCLSALHPTQMKPSIEKLLKLLKGCVTFVKTLRYKS